MSEILLPIGQPLGRSVASNSEPAAATAAVRIANDFHALTVQQYRLWLAGFNHSDRAQLEQAARGFGVSDTASTISELLELGALIAFDSEADLTEPLSSYSVIAMGFGLGASTEHEGYFEIGGSDLAPRVRVEFDIFLVWAMAHTRSIWSTCQIVAEQEQFELAAVARHVAMNLTLLTRSGCALLDKAFQR
ncbi:MAG: hypothetical protein ACRDPW_11455 [Mycobacteriales bacterium]